MELKEKETCSLFEDMLANEIVKVSEMQEGEEKDQAVKNIAILVEAKEKLDKGTVEVKRVEIEEKKLEIEKKKLEENSKLENRKLTAIIASGKTELILRGIDLGVRAADVGAKIGYMGGMFKSEYKDEKIIAGRTSNILQQRLK